jgi:hypothetical protein
VLEKATQSRPEDRFQTVEEFWDEIADASLPPTRPLQMVTAAAAEPRRKPSADLSIEPDDFTEAAPPRPHFAIPEPRGVAAMENDSIRRPRIVVPISEEARRLMELRARQQREVERSLNDTRQERRASVTSVLPPSRTKRAIVAAGLILAFSGMLLATHKYVTTRWNPLASIPGTSDFIIVGREGVTTTDVNLRPIASSSANQPIGLAESGSKVRVLSANSDNNWVEILVVEHSRPKTDPYSSDRGWVNKRFIKFD